MRFLNKLGLPQEYVNAVKGDYDMGDADISVTSLIDSPKVYFLRKRHDEEVEVEVADMVWLVFGSAVHDYLEKFQDDNKFTEERMYAEVGGWKISGKVDTMTLDTITDWKTTSQWTVLWDATKFAYEAQMNCYAYLASKYGFKITKLQNIFIMRDWHYTHHLRNSDIPEYAVTEPQQQDKWPLDDAEKYIADRVRLFQSYKDLPDDSVPVCTKDERWHSEDKYAIMKTGRKSAIRVLDTQAEADKLLAEKHKGATHIEFREGQDKRCTPKYCSVCKWCNFYKETKED